MSEYIGERGGKKIQKMVVYSNNEKTDMFETYVECRKNAKYAAREYAVKFPDRQHPSRSIFTRLENTLRQYGSFEISRKKPKINKRATNEANTAAVLASVVADPGTSIRKIGQNIPVSYSSIQRILKNSKMHSYSYTRVQQLYEGDQERRMNFCRTLLAFTENDPRFLKHICWTDESKFDQDGITNYHNLHHWAVENPHCIRPVNSQRRFSINVWCGIIDNTLLGPFFYEGNLNQVNYLEFLTTRFEEYLNNAVAINQRRNVIFQHDGAPAHTANTVSRYLGQRFETWIGNNGPIRWPPRSPDLTVLDYFLWGYLKSLVYDKPPKPQNLDELIEKIEISCRSLTPDILERATNRSMMKRLRLCLNENGDSFQHLL